MTTREKYFEKMKDWGRSYHALFPIIRSLKKRDDVQAFMEAYVDLMKPIVKSRLDRPIGTDSFFDDTERSAMERGERTLEDAAKNLAADNFCMMANIYYANTDKRVPRCWDDMIIEVTGFEKTRGLFT